MVFFVKLFFYNFHTTISLCQTDRELITLMMLCKKNYKLCYHIWNTFQIFHTAFEIPSSETSNKSSFSLHPNVDTCLLNTESQQSTICQTCNCNFYYIPSLEIFSYEEGCYGMYGMSGIRLRKIKCNTSWNITKIKVLICNFLRHSNPAHTHTHILCRTNEKALV